MQELSKEKSLKRKKYIGLTYLEYCKLPSTLQDEYLTWNQKQFQIERERIQLERQGGVEGLAKKKGMQEVDFFNRVTTWSYLHAYTPQYKIKDKKSLIFDMFNSNPIGDPYSIACSDFRNGQLINIQKKTHKDSLSLISSLLRIK